MELQDKQPHGDEFGPVWRNSASLHSGALAGLGNADAAGLGVPGSPKSSGRLF